jgi:hypothetical protein
VTTTLEPVLKIIVERKDGFHVMSHDNSKHLGGPYATKVQAQRRLRQVEHFKDQDKADVEKWLTELRKYDPGQPRAKDGKWSAVGRGAATAARGAGRGAKATGRAIKPTLKVLGKVAIAGAIVGAYAYTTYHSGNAKQTAYKLDSDVINMMKGKPKGATHAAAHIRGNKVQTGFAASSTDWADVRSHFTVDSGGGASPGTARTAARARQDSAREGRQRSQRGPGFTSSYSVDASGRATPNTQFLRKADDGVLITMPLDGFDKDEFVKAIMSTVVAKQMLDDFRKQYNPSQPREKNGRFARVGGSALGVAARHAGQAVRGKVNVKNTKKVARSAMHIAKPIMVTVGKAAFAGAMAGLVMGVEMTFSNAGSDVGRAAGATAAAAANHLKGQAEEKAGMFVTARVRKKGNGGSVTVQPGQRVDPSARSFDLADVSTPRGSTSPYGTPINTPGASSPSTSSAVRTTPYMAHSGVIKSTVSKTDDAVLRDDDCFIVMALEDFDEAQFAAAVNKEVSRMAKRLAFFGGAC